MLFKYKTTTPEGETKEGEIDAVSFEVALNTLQKRNLIVVSLDPLEDKPFFLQKDIFSFDRVKNKDIVIFFRQISTLFAAKVPALTSFELLSSETENAVLKKYLIKIVEDIKGGLKISDAMAKHPKVFSEFHTQLVKSGEEAGKLEEVFNYLADYVERSYELTSKAMRALIYPAFVVFTFIVVVALMMVVVIPQLSSIIKESGQEAPVYTKIVLAISDFLVAYGIYFVLFLIVLVIALWRYSRTSDGKIAVSRLQISIPYVGDLYKKIYVSRIADNLQTLLSGGVSTLRSLEITKDVIENNIYKDLMYKTAESVKGGSKISESFLRFEEMPHLVSQMVKIGEETGKMNFILKTLAGFYKNEVDRALDALVSVIEPLMVILLGVVVGFLLASVLIPIYNIAMSV